VILLDTNICIHIINARPAAVLQRVRCWRQPEVVWINPPPPEHGVNSATLPMAA